MAENVTTLNEIREKQTEASIALSDLLYLVKGTGSDRDRAQTLEELRDFLGNNSKEIKILYEDQYQKKYIHINEDGLVGTLDSGSWTLSFSLTNEGLILKDRSSGTEYKIGLKELGAVLPYITAQNITASKISVSEITSESDKISINKSVEISQKITAWLGLFDSLQSDNEINSQKDYYRIAKDVIALNKAGQTPFFVSWVDGSGFVVSAGEVNASKAVKVDKYVTIQKGTDSQIGGIWFSNGSNRNGSIYLENDGQIHINSNEQTGIVLDRVTSGQIGVTNDNDNVKLIQRHYKVRDEDNNVTIKLTDGESCFIYVGKDNDNSQITVNCGDISKKITHVKGTNKYYFVHRFEQELVYSMMNQGA